MRVLIVDDHRLLGEAMRTLLQANGDHVVTTVTTGQEALYEVARNQTDVVLVDMILPGEDGTDIGRKILEASPGTKVVAFTALDAPGRTREAAAAGFHGYITKDVATPRLLAYLNTVLRSEVRVAAAPVRDTMRSVPGSDEWQARFAASQLTRRERQVLELLMDGAEGDSIASALSISLNTVRTHIQNVLSKLQVHSRLEAVAFAARHGIVTPPTRQARAVAGTSANRSRPLTRTT